MKSSAITRIVIYSLLVVLLTGLLGSALVVHAYGNWGLFGLMDDDRDDDYDDEDAASFVTAENGEKISVDAKEIRKIEVEWVSGEVTVEPGDVDSIQIQETQTDEPLRYSVKGDTLEILFCRPSIRIGWGWNRKLAAKDLTITVPKEWDGSELEIESVNADVLIRDLKVQKLDYSGVSGKGTLENCQVGKLEAETVSGNVKLSGSIRELECSSVSADCDLVVTNVPDKISLEGVSGSLDLTLPADAGFTADIDGIKKDLDTDFAVTRRNGSYIAGDGSCKIEIEGVSGKAKIQKAK